MPDYFAEKAEQVKPDNLVAFGIPISSRYGKADELIEMLSFCQLVAEDNIAHSVKELFYDSKANICSITLVDSVASGDRIATQAHIDAKKSIRQFMLFDYLDHGADLAEED